MRSIPTRHVTFNSQKATDRSSMKITAVSCSAPENVRHLIPEAGNHRRHGWWEISERVEWLPLSNVAKSILAMTTGTCSYCGFTSVAQANNAADWSFSSSDAARLIEAHQSLRNKSKYYSQTRRHEEKEGSNKDNDKLQGETCQIPMSDEISARD